MSDRRLTARGGSEKDDRYARQRALPVIGVSGQKRLADASVLVAGCGALGTNAAELLARAGVGRIALVDSDTLEATNLQRQALVGENDLGRLKASATAEALRRINSTITVTHEVVRVDRGNVERLIAGADLILDGFDNLPSRYLLNDACVKHRVPWVFAAVAATCGMVLPILPDEGPCLRCLFPDPAPEERVLTAGNAGLINTIPRAIVAMQVTLGIRVLLGLAPQPASLVVFDIWEGTYTAQAASRGERCPCCGEGRYEFLEGGDA